MAVTVEGLEISLKSDAIKVTNALESLVANMTKLHGEADTAVKSLKEFNIVLERASEIAKSVNKSFNGVASKIKKVTEALSAMNKVSSGSGSEAQTAFNGMADSASQAAESVKNAKDSITDINKGLDGSKKKVDEAKKKALSVEEIINKLKRDKAANIFSGISAGVKKLTSGFRKLVSSIGRIAVYRAIRFALSEITKSLKEGVENVYKFSQAMGTAFHGEVDQAVSTFAQLKNQLGSMASEVITKLQPALMDILARGIDIADTFSQVFAFMNGKTTYLRANYVAEAWQESEDAAKKYKNTVLGIDELNIISKDSGNDTKDYASMFREVAIDTEKVSAALEKVRSFMDVLLNVATAVGAVILSLETFRLANGITETAKIFKELGGLKAIKTLFEGYKIPVGLTLSITGFIFEYKGAYSIGKDGFSIKNVLETVLGGAFGIFGGIVAFGSASLAVTIPLAIGLAVSGISLGMLSKGKDAFKSTQAYQDLQNLKSEIEANATVTAEIKLDYATRTANMQSILSDISNLKTEIDRVLFLNDKDNLTSAELNEIKMLIADIQGSGISLDIDSDGHIKDTKNDLYEILQTMLQTKLAEHIADNAIENLLAIEKQKTATDDLRIAYVEAMASLDSATREYTSNVGHVTLDEQGKLKAEMDLAKEVFESALKNYKEAQDSLSDLKKEQQFFNDVQNGTNGILETLYKQLGLTTQGWKDATKEVENYSNALASIPKTSIGNGKSGFSMVSFDTFATGGYPESGQLFLANEQGPELVGAIGNRTAVANGDQIVNGIQNGVSSAVSAVLAPYLAQIANNTRETANKDLSVNIGDRDIARANARGSRALGRTIISTT